MLKILNRKLIVSCQPVLGGPMDQPEIVAAFASAAIDGGAAGLRIEGLRNIESSRRVTDLPIIGLIKHDLDHSPVRITPFVQNVVDLVAAGADIVAFDATNRPRPESIAAIISCVKEHGALAMADCASVEDGIEAFKLGADILGSTMSGYTGGQIPDAPDLDLLRKLATLGSFIVAEGRYHIPEQAAMAISAGANAVVVGSAITRTEHVTSWFSNAIVGAAQDNSVAGVD